jgi:DDE superfamily endonuclease
LAIRGFIGTDYITTPIRKPECRELLQWEHGWNNQVSSFRAPVERAVATLKTWRILFTDYRWPLKTFMSSFRAAIGLYFFKERFA